MAGQQHRILRQVIDVSGCARDEARALQSLMRDRFRSALLPALEQVFDELSEPGRVHRIDRLVIDLGILPADGSEEVLAERLKAALAPRLAAALVPGAAVQSDLELFNYLVQTGSLPWWAERGVRELPARALRRLAAQSPQPLAGALREIAAHPAWLRRTVLLFADAELEQLLRVVLPASTASDSLRGIGESGPLLLAAAADEAGASPTRVRADWWSALLRAGVSDAPRGGAALLRVALAAMLQHRPSMAAPAVWRRMALALEAGALVRFPRLQDLWREAIASPDPAAAPAAVQVLRALFTAWAGQGGDPAALRLWADMARTVDQLPAPLLRRAAAALEPVPGDEAAAGMAALVLAALQAGRGEAAAIECLVVNATALPPLPGWSAAASTLLRQRLGRVEVAAGVKGRSPPDDRRAAPSPPATPVDLRFSDTEALYIGNAGLVLLWPFISSLFRRLGLVVDKTFINEDAALRGAGLLHYVATGELDVPEPELALNKLLCGLPAEAVFEFGEPISAAEAEECDAMLQAAIAQAPILHEMSAAGFRGSFLLREGQLGTRDERWLLRVERQTWDVVLDRFPWGFGLVKLPWMTAMLQVEW